MSDERHCELNRATLQELWIKHHTDVHVGGEGAGQNTVRRGRCANTEDTFCVCVCVLCGYNTMVILPSNASRRTESTRNRPGLSLSSSVRISVTCSITKYIGITSAMS